MSAKVPTVQQRHMSLLQYTYFTVKSRYILLRYSLTRSRQLPRSSPPSHNRRSSSIATIDRTATAIPSNGNRRTKPCSVHHNCHAFWPYAFCWFSRWRNRRRRPGIQSVTAALRGEAPAARKNAESVGERAASKGDGD